MDKKEEPSSKKKPVVVSPFQKQSNFGGTHASSPQGRSQYKPSPVRITQHKG